ncbi:hypothetical protein [Mucilaginibacter sp.]|jgi:hypothetical protein|uniref:hypothetical protein n=1 Tax=Mucilaginibacter sp. TaxID=1882438 RepID=UPI00356A16C8
MKKIKTFFGTGFMVAVLFLSAPAFAQTAEQQPQTNNDQANDIQAFLKKYQKNIARKELNAAKKQNVSIGIGWESPLTNHTRNMQPSLLQTQALAPYLTPTQVQQVTFAILQNSPVIYQRQQKSEDNEQAKRLADPQLVRQQIQEIKLQEFAKQQDIKEKVKTEPDKE